MEIVYLDETFVSDLEASCVAVGFFDGMHLGHQKLIEQVVTIAKEKKLKKALMTFDVHPKSYIAKQEFKELMTLQDKADFLKKYEFDYLFVLKFSNQMASMEPIDFIKQYIINTNVKHVICGFDFHFGNHGIGNYQVLIDNKSNLYDVTVVSKQEYQHHKISSSYLKKALSEGDVSLAKNLLGRYYRVSGKVIHGLKNGRKIGFPTINVDVKNYVLPKNGVYGAIVLINGMAHLAMANIGYNPTFNVLTKVSLEVNIFDFDQDVYNQQATVIFIKRTRDEKKFSSIEQLIMQLTSDRQQIKDEIGMMEIYNKNT